MSSLGQSLQLERLKVADKFSGYRQIKRYNENQKTLE